MGTQGYIKKIKEEFRSVTFYRDCAAEFFATFLLLVIQCALVLQWKDKDNNVGIGVPIHVGIGMGFIVTAMVTAFGEFGGAHMNPAFSVGFAVAMEITVTRAICYIIAQCVGGICGAGFVYGVTHVDYRDKLAATTVDASLTPFQGTMVELVLTAIVMFTIWGATNKLRRGVYMPAVPIGMAVGLDILAMVKWTGASMNPARTLGPAVLMNIWEHHWVYWAGPCAGAIVATIIFHMMNWPGKKALNDKKEQDEDLYDIAKQLQGYIAKRRAIEE